MSDGEVGRGAQARGQHTIGAPATTAGLCTKFERRGESSTSQRAITLRIVCWRQALSRANQPRWANDGDKTFRVSFTEDGKAVLPRPCSHLWTNDLSARLYRRLIGLTYLQFSRDVQKRRGTCRAAQCSLRSLRVLIDSLPLLSCLGPSIDRPRDSLPSPYPGGALN